MKQLAIGVIGLNFGTHHVRTLANLDGVRLVAVADANRALAERHAVQYRVNAFSDGAEMIAREALDGVVIATSPAPRGTLLEAAASKRVPAFVEKPWALNGAHARELADLCRTSGARVMLGFSFRYLPAIAKLRELLQGELGQPLVATGAYVSNWLPPAEHWLWDKATGGGYFNENSCHLFDTVNALLGQPVSLQAQTRKCFGRPGPDAALVTIRYASGAIASVAMGGIGANAFQDYPGMELVTVKGQARLAGHQHVWDRLTWASRSDNAVHTADLPPESLGETRYSRALREFARCIRDNAPFPSTIEDGMVCVRMAEAVVEAGESGGSVDLG